MTGAIVEQMTEEQRIHVLFGRERQDAVVLS
jgi:hypothetical protein